MAFDRPLESDRVDDLSLLGLLTRAPVIGSIMWFLGGQQARDEEEKELQQQRDLELLLSNPPELRSALQGSSQYVCKSALRKSDTLTDCTDAMEDMTMTEKPLKRKNISWSDEDGKDLVEFIGQIKGCGVTVSDSTGDAGDKGVMPRSTSVRRRMENQQDEVEAVFLPLALHKRVEQMSAEPRYLPRGLDKAHNGIRVPRMPTYSIEQASSGSSEGVESPQWGWFLRTTPPTPQMYSRPFHQKNYPSTGDASLSSTGTESSVNTLPGSHPNAVFQGMQDRHKTMPIGWSSVPL